MRIIKPVVIAAAAALLLSACGSNNASKYDFTMPDQPTEFVGVAYADPSDTSDEPESYASVQFDGKTYVMYGELTGELDKSEVGKCLGYMVQPSEQGDVKIEDIRFFTLTSDPDQNFLLCMDAEGRVDPPKFYRSVETVGKDITIPSFIKSSELNIWNK